MKGRVYTTIIPPDIGFEAWNKTGSIYKAPEYLKREYNIVNPKSGKMVSPQGVWGAAGRYIISNPNEARKQLDEVYKANGMLLSDRQWYEIVYNCQKYFSRKVQQDFITRHAYMKPFFDEFKNAQ